MKGDNVWGSFELWTNRLNKSQLFVIVTSCLGSFLPSSFFPLSFTFSGATHSQCKQEQPFIKPCSLSGQDLPTTFFFFGFPLLSLTVLPYSSTALIVPFPLLPSLALVKQQGPCDRKLRKLPIKEDMYLTGESEGGTGVCIKAKERVIWRCLSWTSQFPVSGTGQKYPEKSSRVKDTPPHFSCDLLYSAN